MRIEGTPPAEPNPRLRGLNKFPPQPSPNLRGLEKFAKTPEEVDGIARDIGEVVVEPATSVPRGALRGLDKFRSKANFSLPEDYNIPAEVLEKARKIISDEQNQPFVDPEGLIISGQLFSSSADERRRLVIDLVQNKRSGTVMVMAHIEGGNTLFKYDLGTFSEKIKDGDLRPLEP